MKSCMLLFLVTFLQCNKVVENDLEYFSLEKSHFNVSYGKLENNFNFYKFQTYYQSIRVDSEYLDQYKYNLDDSLVYKFLKTNYLNRGYFHSLELLSRIGKINSENFNDTGINVIDINDSISLISLSPQFSIYALGSCCSNYQNLLIKRLNDSLVLFNELKTAKLLGVYLTKTGKISALLFQGYSNSKGNFIDLNSTYNFKYKVNKIGIICDEVINVRSGEPFDKNDSIKNIKDFGIVNVYF